MARSLDLDALAVDLYLRILFDLEDLVRANLVRNPIGLLAIRCCCNYVLAQVYSRLNVQIVILHRHASIMHDDFKAFVDIVGIF